MTVRLVGKVRAVVIGPDVPVPYTYTAGEAITAKEVVCKGEADGFIYKAQSNTWLRMPAFGVAIQTKGAGESIQVIQFGTVTDIARVGDFNWDDAIYVSTVAGKATNIPPGAIGDIIQTIGRASNASSVILEVDETVVEIAS